ncbi:MAG: response regulator [Candidatus Hydrogenedentes bacterium]|nr:response regulator [Candidatus Hydrogenedentota bacterium]
MTQILLVDDEMTVRETLAAYLEDDGFHILEAGSGEEAVHLLEKGCRPKVCIMDMRLPGMDGHDAILALHARMPELRFLIYTGSLSYGLPDDLRAIGMDDAAVFRKPVQDMRQLADTVRSLMALGANGHA